MLLFLICFLSDSTTRWIWPHRKLGVLDNFSLIIFLRSNEGSKQKVAQQASIDRVTEIKAYVSAELISWIKINFKFITLKVPSRQEKQIQEDTAKAKWIKTRNSEDYIQAFAFCVVNVNDEHTKNKDGICSVYCWKLLFDSNWYICSITESVWFWKRIPINEVPNNHFLKSVWKSNCPEVHRESEDSYFQSND